MVDLEQTSLALVPMTEHLRRSLGDRHRAVMPGFHGLTEALRDWAVSDSRETPVAYVEMESHGGAGRQASVGWPWGDIAWGPRFTCNTVTDCDEIFELVSPDDIAINGVLRWLGVRRDGAADEFEAAGSVDIDGPTNGMQPHADPRQTRDAGTTAAIRVRSHAARQIRASVAALHAA